MAETATLTPNIHTPFLCCTGSPLEAAAQSRSTSLGPPDSKWGHVLVFTIPGAKEIRKYMCLLQNSLS